MDIHCWGNRLSCIVSRHRRLAVILSYIVLELLCLGIPLKAAGKLIAFDPVLYVAAAKSVAEGRGYRLSGLASEPKATLYPPGQSVLLATSWLGGASLAQATLRMSVTMLALCVGIGAMTAATGRRLGLAAFDAWAVGAFTMLDLSYLAANFYSEPLFTFLILSAALLMTRNHTSYGAMLAIGAVIGLTILTRTAGLSFAVAVALWVAFGSGNVPATRRVLVAIPVVASVLGWRAWVGHAPSYLDVMKDHIHQVGAAAWGQHVTGELVGVATGWKWAESLFHPIAVAASRLTMFGMVPALACQSFRVVTGLLLFAGFSIAAWNRRAQLGWVLLAGSGYVLQVALWPIAIGSRGFQPLFWAVLAGAFLTAAEKLSPRALRRLRVIACAMIVGSAFTRALESYASDRMESLRMAEFSEFLDNVGSRVAAAQPIGLTAHSPLLNLAMRLPNRLVSLDEIFLGPTPTDVVPNVWIRAASDAAVYTNATGVATAEVIFASSRGGWSLNLYQPKPPGPGHGRAQ